ncbi:MAG TPA: phage Gp37/Gp68 family protein [Phycisphaerae bacterium]|nr:phage Gp37/Gp68 family protein [Phycisphaerae bacterium]
MSEHKIGWLNVPGYKGETWNPIIGCSKCSPGCQHCYAERMAGRLVNIKQTEYYSGVVNHLVENSYGRVVDTVWNGKTAFVESALEKPLHWKQPRVIFVCSMSDLFHETVPFEWIDQVFAIMARCPQHKFLLLTKRPQRMVEYFANIGGTSRHDWVWTCMARQMNVSHLKGINWPLPNVGIGVTICNQEEADAKIPMLLSIPAAMRFVSIEPMLGKIVLQTDTKYCETCGLHFNPIEIESEIEHRDGSKTIEVETFCERCHEIEPEMMSTVCGCHIGLDWIIVGGESGPKARPMHPDWVRNIQQQCSDSGVPFFFKQNGEWLNSDKFSEGEIIAAIVCNRWYVFDDGIGMIQCGKQRAGHLLDGLEYREYPKWIER